ncbi:MAG: glycosyltransferase [bacterium]|nr:glycosyltransferase [bacterium]
MTICCFGDYDPDYARTRVYLHGLRLHGVKILHCNLRGGGVGKYWKLAKMLARFPEEYDLVLVPMSNARIFPFIAKLVSSKPVVWEPLFSLYDNWVSDRRLVEPYHPKAWFYWLLDWLASTSSDLIVLDNEAHINYFNETFGVPKRKMISVLIGADNRFFFPRPRMRKGSDFEVEFHGGYIPVQGPDIIARAAKLLERDHVHFTMIGSGQEAERTRALAKTLGVSNVTFLPYLSPEEVALYVANADVCLGHTGDRPRIVRSLPNKLYEAAAMERAVIIVDTPALREVFSPGVDVVTILPGNSEDLARAIRELKQEGNSDIIGKAAKATYEKTGTPEVIGGVFLAALHQRGWK